MLVFSFVYKKNVFQAESVVLLRNVIRYLVANFYVPGETEVVVELEAKNLAFFSCIQL